MWHSNLGNGTWEMILMYLGECNMDLKIQLTGIVRFGLGFCVCVGGVFHLCDTINCIHPHGDCLGSWGKMHRQRIDPLLSF